MLRDARGLRCGGWWPAAVSRGGAAAGQGVLRHSVEQIIENFVPVQILDGPLPQSSIGGVQDQNLQRTAELVAGEVVLVIEVPKISFQDRIPHRASLAVPQMAEQLAEVPTILYFLKQTVVIPVPRNALGHGGLQGFLPEQSFPCSSALSSRSMTFQFQVVVFLAMEVFNLFTQHSVPCSRLSSRSLTFQFPVAIDNFPQDRVSRRFAVMDDLVEVFIIFFQMRVQLRFAVIGDLKVFKLFSQYRVQWRFLERNMDVELFMVYGEVEGLVEVFKTLSQDRVQQRLGGADDVDDAMRRSAELLEYTRRFLAEVEEEEAEQEEETEEMDLDVVTSHFQGHSRLRRLCPSIVRDLTHRWWSESEGRDNEEEDVCSLTAAASICI